MSATRIVRRNLQREKLVIKVIEINRVIPARYNGQRVLRYPPFWIDLRARDKDGKLIAITP